MGRFRISSLVLAFLLTSCSGSHLGQDINAVFLSFTRRIGFGNTPPALVDLCEQKVARITAETQNVQGIYVSDFVETINSNHIRTASQFKGTADSILTDKMIPLSAISRFYGVEDGKVKVGRLDQFKDETIVLPVRNKNHGYISLIVGPEGEERRNKLYFRPLFRTIRARNELKGELRGEVREGKEAFLKARRLVPLPQDYKKATDSLYCLLYTAEAAHPSLESDTLRSLYRTMLLGSIARKKLSPKSIRKYLPLVSPYPAVGHYKFYDADGRPVEEETLSNAIDGKIFMADSLGHGVFINRLKDFSDKEMDELNRLLGEHPMCPILIDNGRYARFYLEEGSYQEYISQDLYHPDDRLYVIGSIRQP